jgi:hypothetical protein
MIVANWRSGSRALCAVSVALFVVGIGMTTVNAPCYSPGAVVTEIAVSAAALACLGSLVAAVKAQSSWGWFVVSTMGTCFMFLVGYVWTLLLCRGV